MSFVFQRGGRSVTATVDNRRAMREADEAVELAGDAILGTATAPSGSEAVGERQLVIATATDDFAGREGSVATRITGGWTFRDAIPGERFFLASLRLVWFYDPVVALLRPLNPPSSTTEQDTGRLGPNGDRVWRKVIACGAAPNATLKLVAHGITGLPLGKGAYLMWRATASNGSVPFPLPSFDASSINLAVDGTNIVILTNFNATAHDIIVELEYER